MTIFEKILTGEMVVDKVFENDYFIAINDIAPKAKIHLLIIPKQKAQNLADLASYSADYCRAILNAPATLAKHLGLSSFRVISNCGSKAGQTVDYLHFHFLCDDKLEHTF